MDMVTGMVINDELIHNITRKSVYHGGGIVGFKNKITSYHNDEVCIIVLNNLSITDVDDITNNLAKLIFQEI